MCNPISYATILFTVQNSLRTSADTILNDLNIIDFIHATEGAQNIATPINLTYQYHSIFENPDKIEFPKSKRWEVFSRCEFLKEGLCSCKSHILTIPWISPLPNYFQLYCSKL
jgi:hypothetical protein